MVVDSPKELGELMELALRISKKANQKGLGSFSSDTAVAIAAVPIYENLHETYCSGHSLKMISNKVSEYCNS